MVLSQLQSSLSTLYILAFLIQYKLSQNSEHLSPLMNSPIFNCQSTLTPLQSQDGLIFGVTFKNHDSLIALYKEHFYSLFLLLYAYGEDHHKSIMASKAQKCIQSYQRKIIQHSSQCRTCRSKSTIFQQNPCKQMKVGEVKIKILQYFKKQVEKKNNPEKVQLHPQLQRQCIRNASIDIFQLESLPSIRDLSFFSITKLACSLLQIQCKVIDYYNTHIIEFCCSEFYKKGLAVFIEINDDNQTYYYLKRKSDQVCHNKLNTNNDSENILSQMQNLSNSSFHNLLKNEISFEGNARDNSYLTHNTSLRNYQQEPETQSKLYQQEGSASQDQTSYLEQSQVLENLSKVQIQNFKKKVSEEIPEDSPKIQIKIVNRQIPERNQEEEIPELNRCESEYSEEQVKNDEKENIEKSMNDPPKTNQTEIRGGDPTQSNKRTTKDNCLFNQNNKESFYEILEINRFAKSGCIQSPKKQRVRKKSDTLNQKLNLEEFESSFHAFAEKLDHQALLVNQSIQCYQGQTNQMLESKTFPFSPENFEIQPRKDVQHELNVGNRQAIDQLVTLVRSGKAIFTSDMVEKYSFQQMIEAIEKLESEDNFTESKILEKTEESGTVQQKEIDFMTILSAIFKEQKQQKIHQFIQNAKKALKQYRFKLKSPPIKRGQQMIKFSRDQQERFQKKQSETLLMSHIFEEKGVLGINLVKTEEKNPISLNKSKVMTLSQYGSPIQAKSLKYFSPQISKKG